MSITGTKGNIEIAKGLANVGLSACVYNTALSLPQVLAEVPVTSTTTGTVMVPCQGHNLLMVMVAGTDAAGETIGYHALGAIPSRRTDYPSGNIVEKAAEGVWTLGLKQVGTGGAFIEASTSLWADTVTETTSNGVSRPYSPADDTAAYLLIDCSRYQFVIIQASRNGQTAATFDIITQVCDSMGGFASIDLGDAADIATATLQGAANTLLGTIDTDTGLISGGIGTTADAPLAGDTAETTTVRTGISLWKRAVNKLIEIKALLVKGTAGTTASIAVTVATDDAVIGATDASVAAAGGVGSVSAKLRKLTTDLSTIDADTGSIKTNTDTLVAGGGGGYVRQDSTSTIAKETGGNLAAVAADMNELTTAPVASALTRLPPVVIGTPGTPVVLIASETFATKLILQAGRATAANASPVSIGGNIAYTTDLQVQLAPGDTYVVEDRLGRKFDMNLIYIDGVNTDDGVRGQYFPA